MANCSLCDEKIRTMATMINSQLNFGAAHQLFHQLTLELMESTLGGNTLIPLWDSSYHNLDLSTFPDHDELNDSLTKPLTFYNNKILTIDFSNTNVYLVV